MAIPKDTTVRTVILILGLGIAYFGVFGILSRLTPLQDRDLLVVFGIFTASLLLTIYITVYHWITWAAQPPEQIPTEYEPAKAILEELQTKFSLDVELRVVKAERIFIYAAGMSRKMILISDGALRKLSPLALRGVLAHELGHMTLNHAARNATVFAAFFGFRIALSFPSGMNIYLVMLLLMYLRNNEYEADRVAALVVGKEPLFAALDEVQTLTKMRDFSVFFEFLFSTHPSYKRRRHRLSSYTHSA